MNTLYNKGLRMLKVIKHNKKVSAIPSVKGQLTVAGKPHKTYDYGSLK